MAGGSSGGKGGGGAKGAFGKGVPGDSGVDEARAAARERVAAGLAPGRTPDERRRRALAALAALAPLPGGDALLAEVYSPHLDVYQRLIVLDALCGAAKEMAADPRRAPRLEAAGGGGGSGRGPPRIVAGGSRGGSGGGGVQRIGHAPAAAAAAALVDAAPAAGGGDGGCGDGGSNAAPGAVVAPGLREASTRVSRPATLRKLQEQQLEQQQLGGGTGAATTSGAGPRTFRNRFAPVALRWAAALLRSCDQPRHGVDLFGRDALLLGRLLATLGTFMECAKDAPPAAPLAAGLLELLRAPEVHAHAEAYVRRCALAAAAQVAACLPAARLAGAAVGGGRGDAADEALVGRLEWMRGWAAEAAARDPDESCRLLAAGAAALHARLASEALAAAEALPDADALDPGGLLLAGVGGGGARQAGGRRRRGGRGSGAVGGAMDGVTVRVPSISRLQLG